MNEKWLQQKGENRTDYIKRITNLKSEYGMTYSEWCYLVTGGAEYSEDNSRKAYYIVEKMLPLISYQLEIDEAQIKKYNDLHSKEVQIMKEREKQKDERRAFTSKVRAEARWEHLLETIADGMENFDTKKFLDKYITNYECPEDNEALLMISDTHIGMTVDNKLNKYNKEICIERFNELVKQTINNCKRNSVSKLNIVFGGDIIEGIINTSGRVQQNEDVVQQIFTASELLTELLIKLSLAVPKIRVWSVNGNHARMRKDVKEAINGESFESMIYEYVKLRVENIKYKEKIGWNIKFNDNDYPDLAIVEIENCDKTVAVAHGTKDRNAKNNVSRINQFLDINIDYYFMGHLHNSHHQNNCYVNGCLAGSNEYAQNQRYNNEPIQIMMIFFENGSTNLCEMNLR